MKNFKTCSACNHRIALYPCSVDPDGVECEAPERPGVHKGCAGLLALDEGMGDAGHPNTNESHNPEVWNHD